jgi:hypothetical protein
MRRRVSEPRSVLVGASVMGVLHREWAAER